MSQLDHPVIWLEPTESDPELGRQWCQDNAWGEDAIKYVRADIVAKLTEALEEMVKAVELTECPHPIKEAGDDMAVSCINAGVCGCRYGALHLARAALEKAGRSS